jgi:hypothetical protein
MSRKIPKQDLPHYGVKNGMTRNNGTVKNADGELQFHGTVSQAKRFMRTGSASR